MVTFLAMPRSAKVPASISAPSHGLVSIKPSRYQPDHPTWAIYTRFQDLSTLVVGAQGHGRKIIFLNGVRCTKHTGCPRS